MKRILRKLTTRRGETLTETLAALLVICLASAALAAMVTAASRMNAAAMQKDAALYAAVTQTETHSGEGTDGTVDVTVDGEKITFDVDYYGDDTLTSYGYPRKGAG